MKDGMNGLFIMGAVILAIGGALLSWNGLIDREVRITSGSRRGPTRAIALFRGGESILIGAGALAMTAGSVCLFLGSCKARRSPWTPGTRRLLVSSMLLLLVSVLLCIPPWKVRLGEFAAAYYAFLVPAMRGTWQARRGKAVVVVSLLGGAALSGVVGRAANPTGLMAALFSYLFLGLLLYCLLEERKERQACNRDEGIERSR